MRILVITSLFTPYRRGGAEVFVGNLVEELKKNHSVSVLTCGEWEGIFSLVPRVRIQNGVRVIRYYPLNLFSFIHINKHGFIARCAWGALDMVNLHSAIVLLLALKRESPDRILVHGLKGLGYVLAWLLNAIRAAWIFTPHDVQLVVPSGVLAVGNDAALTRPFLRLYRCVTRTLVGSPPVVVCSSRYLLDFYMRYGFFPSSITRVIPSPTPIVSAVLRHAPKSPRVVFLFIGQLVEGKGIRLVLDVFDQLGRPDLELHIVGSGPLEYFVREASIRDSRIRVFGYCDDLGKYKRFADTTYTIVASTIIENSPSVVYESLSLGVPAIVAISGGAAELIEDGVNGFQFKPGNLSSLHNALVRALSVRDYERMSQRARDTVAHFTPEWYTRVLLALSVFEDQDSVIAK